MSPKTILITGATSGLGRALAVDFAGCGHTLLLHGRDQPRLKNLATSLDTTTRTYLADLSSLHAVRAMTDALLENEPRIDVLIANAGIGGGPRRESAEGYELNFAVNYLSHYLLITRLIDRLRVSAPARIVLVSSIGQMPVDFDDVMLERGYDRMRAYCQSKLAQIAFGLRLARTLDPAEVSVLSLHPASEMPTNMVGRRDGDPIALGVATTTRLALDPALNGVSGTFYDRDRQTMPHPWATDPAAQDQLWRLSAEMVA
jgi:NAD(P)-dependent dehydrogenase (short-subunit alcohol dehydrogenase family)